jgi:hypothetical protein
LKPFCRRRRADDQRAYIALNAQLAKEWKVIIESKDPLPDADDWARSGQAQYLERWSLETPGDRAAAHRRPPPARPTPTARPTRPG